MDFEKLSYEELKEINKATSKEIARRENERKFELLFNIKVAIETWQKEFLDSPIPVYDSEDNFLCLSDIDLSKLTRIMENL